MFLLNMWCCGKVISAEVLPSVKDTLDHVAVLLNWCEPPYWRLLHSKSDLQRNYVFTIIQSTFPPTSVFVFTGIRSDAICLFLLLFYSPHWYLTMILLVTSSVTFQISTSHFCSFCQASHSRVLCLSTTYSVTINFIFYNFAAFIFPFLFLCLSLYFTF